jgi:membrane-bound lytic murein transglycosylase D
MLGLGALLVVSCASKKTAEVAETPLPVEPESATPAPDKGPADQQEPDKVGELYTRLGESQREYKDAIELLLEGADVEDEILKSILDRIRMLAAECSQTEGCDSSRFIDTLMVLMDEQAVALKSRNAQIESMLTVPEEEQLGEDLEREPGTSPFVSAMPDLGDTVSLLRGTDLRDIIELNGPVNAALDDWLTWMRPQLIESYVNYHFLRNKIAPIYEEAGLPEALLFAIMATETGGKVHAYSRAGAAGPLQFMRHTGRKYGLRTVDGFDMRLDPAAATKANVAYLNDQFKVLNNSLEQALAAYNGGENRMRRLHRRYKDMSFWDSRFFYRLPRETREYVPRVLAAAWLFMHPEDYNLVWPELETETAEIVVQKEVALGELAICFGQEGNPTGWFRTLRNLNPRLNPGERVKAGETLEIPASLVSLYESQCLGGDIVQTAQTLHEANYPYGDMIIYIVQPGDTLGRIASRFRCVTVRDLAEINNIRGPRYLIRVGQRLRIPNCG